MNTRLSLRLKLLGILMALLGTGLGFRVKSTTLPRE